MLEPTLGESSRRNSASILFYAAIDDFMRKSKSEPPSSQGTPSRKSLRIYLSAMIGLVVRSVVGEALGPIGMLLGPLVAVLALCGIMTFCKCRMRDCGCCKRLLRMTGTDPFDDFEVMILVHKVTFTASSKTSTHIRIRAGDHEVCTDPSANGIFQQALSVFVEQGTQVLKIELLNTSDTVLAEMQMNVMKEILHLDKDGKESESTPVHVTEKAFVMKQKCKHVLNPRLTLTFSPEAPGDEEQALLAGINASSEVEWMLQQQLHKTQSEVMGPTHSEKGAAGAPSKAPEQLSELALLAKGCFGPLHQFGTMGFKSQVYVGVLGPPRRKKFALHIWESEHDFRDDKPSKQEIDLLRIYAVSPDPGRPEVFTIIAQDKQDKTAKKKLLFQRIDRSRDVWVELLQILVAKVHDEHDAKKDAKRRK